MKCNEIKRYKIDKGRRTFLKKLSVMGAGIAVGGLPKLVHSQTKKEIVIGGIAPVSGFMAAVGQHEKNSFEMAFEEINAAGGIKSLGGAKIKALFGDDEGKPESGMAEAERLIRAGAVILIGCDLSHVTYATTAIAEKYKVCHIVPMSVADNITERGFKYTFRTTDRTAIQGRRIMRFIKALKLKGGVDIKTGVIMYVDNLYGKSVADSVNNAAKETGVIKILDVIPYPQNPRDLTSEITKAKTYKPDLLMPVSYVPDSILITNTMYEQRFDVMAVLGCSSLHATQDYMQGVGKKGNYVMSATSMENLLSKKFQTYAKKYLSRYGKPTIAHGAVFYEAAYLSADVLERAASTDSEKIRQAFRATNYFSDLVTREGTIYFDETGQCPCNIRALIQIFDGKYYVVDPPQFAQREVVFPIPK